MTSTSSRVVVASLAAILVTLACAAADSHSSPTSPRFTVVAVRAVGGGASAIDGRVRIELRFSEASGGTFTARGAISDRGSFTVRRAVGGRLQLTETLSGRLGTIRIGASQQCAAGAGTWQVLSGTRTYKGLSGGGSARGGPRCSGATYPVKAVYVGAVRTPPPPAPLPIAEPGRYGGATSQRHEVLFDVTPGGRTLTGVTVRRVDGTCTTTSLVASGAISIPGTHEIAGDGSFSLKLEPNSRSTLSISGRFTSRTRATGTASFAFLSADPVTKAPATCTGTADWTASLPPPTAPPGRYCGFTLQGPGICFDVGPSGAEVTRFESAVVARCFPGGVAPTEFRITLTFSGSIPIGGHLGFSRSGIPVEGLVSGTGGISGLIDASGAASGTVFLGATVLNHEGTQYRCHPAVGKWEAKR